jgi:hypothetical protein
LLHIYLTISGREKGRKRLQTSGFRLQEGRGCGIFKILGEADT